MRLSAPRDGTKRARNDGIIHLWLRAKSDAAGRRQDDRRPAAARRWRSGLAADLSRCDEEGSPAHRSGGVGLGRMAELVDALDLGSSGETHQSSSLCSPTTDAFPEVVGRGTANLAGRRGSSSVVEHRLAKARVASSNLVFRSIACARGPCRAPRLLANVSQGKPPRQS